MIFFLAIIACACVAAFFDKKIETVIPAGLFCLMLLSYVLAITNHLSRTVLLGCVLFAFLFLFFALIGFRVYGPIDFIKRFGLSFASVGFWVLVVGSIFISICFKGHFVTNWDDYNYWAMFSKNIALRDAMVSGATSCSVFKDYHPIVQLLYYVVFKSFGGFDEALMFITNNVVLLILGVPFFENCSLKESKSYLRTIVGMLFPASFMFQQLHCLGVDCILCMLFGYLLVRVLFCSKWDIFAYADIALAVFALILTKAAGIMCVAVVVIVAAIKHYHESVKNKLMLILAMLPGALGLISWRLFCMTHGNSSYLTDKAVGSVEGSTFLSFPDYTRDFLLAFGKAILRCRLNDGYASATPVVCMLFVILVAAIWLNKKRTGLGIGILLMAGFVVYLASLLYTYLFVFERWEALSLSSFDRYISIYLLGLMYVALYGLFELSVSVIIEVVVTVAMIATLNYSLLLGLLMPGGYRDSYMELFMKKSHVEQVFDELYKEHGDIYGGRMLIINSERDDELIKLEQYAAVPTVTYVLNMDEDDRDIDKAMSDYNVDCAFIYDENQIIYR